MVVSESARPRPEPAVIEWLERQPAGDVGVSVLTLGEIAKGVDSLAPGRRRYQLAHWLENDLPQWFRDRVLGIDIPVALEWGRLAARRQNLPVVDGLLVATASVHRVTLVTRNVRDCAGLGTPVLDPWASRLYAPEEAPNAEPSFGQPI